MPSTFMPQLATSAPLFVPRHWATMKPHIWRNTQAVPRCTGQYPPTPRTAFSRRFQRHLSSHHPTTPRKETSKRIDPSVQIHPLPPTPHLNECTFLTRPAAEFGWVRSSRLLDTSAVQPTQYGRPVVPDWNFKPTFRSVHSPGRNTCMRSNLITL